MSCCSLLSLQNPASLPKFRFFYHTDWSLETPQMKEAIIQNLSLFWVLKDSFPLWAAMMYEVDEGGVIQVVGTAYGGFDTESIMTIDIESKPQGQDLCPIFLSLIAQELKRHEASVVKIENTSPERGFACYTRGLSGVFPKYECEDQVESDFCVSMKFSLLE